MAITRLGGANAITGTLPAANINNTSIGSVTALPAGVGGKVLQCKNTLSQTGQNITSTSYTNITELTDLAITPSALNNLILVQLNLALYHNGGARVGLDLQMKTGSGSYSSKIIDTEVVADTNTSGFSHTSYALMYPHTIATTDEHQFKLMYKTNNSSYAVGINDNASSSVTLWEIAG